jgi:hypothetical protein
MVEKGPNCVRVDGDIAVQVTSGDGEEDLVGKAEGYQAFNSTSTSISSNQAENVVEDFLRKGGRHWGIEKSVAHENLTHESQRGILPTVVSIEP